MSPPSSQPHPHPLWKALENDLWEQSQNELDHPVNRREFLQLMGASLALAGLTACTKMPPEKIIPYVVAPEGLTPGIPANYASAMTLAGFSKGLLVESHEGRPTKIEGNPLHPASLGTSDLFMQAELLQLYDPERSKTVLHLGEVSSWDRFQASLLPELAKWNENGGEGIAILTETITSPTLSSEFKAFLKHFPRAKWHAYEPINSDSLREASLECFGKDLRPIYDFSQADVVLSLDADFLGPGPTQQNHARAFMSRRKEPGGFNRLYVVESTLSLTGSRADHRLAMRSSTLASFTLALAHELGLQNLPKKKTLSTEQNRWIQEVVKDLQAHRGRCLVLAGTHQPPSLQALAYAMNDRLKNFGTTVSFISSVEESPAPQMQSLEELVSNISDEKVNALLIFGANPVYHAPASLSFLDQFKKVPLRIRLGLYQDETSYYSHWHLPESHFLEAWGDGRAFDGTISFQQPLIAPLYETQAAVEVLSIFLGRTGRTSHQALTEYWLRHLNQESFERSLHDGVLSRSASPPLKGLKIRNGRKTAISLQDRPTSTSELEATIRPDSTVWDGRYANNGWLQELPKPLLQLTWDNAALVSPETASKLLLMDEDEVELSTQGRSIRAPVLRVPGHPDDSITLTLGYGRTQAGKVGNQKGYMAFSVRGYRAPLATDKLVVDKTGKNWRFAMIPSHHHMDVRAIVIRAALRALRSKGKAIIPSESPTLEHPSLNSELDRSENPQKNAWAMVIDLTTCIGCKACTIACQAENNIPIVGKDQVRNGREMHWIRVDRYFEGAPASPRIYFQPVPCMHCENAPCEYVCPTAATVHSSDGINQMVYNRCVGTRYCSNNCPYKVRRFNFFQYADTRSKSLQLMYNPDVTIRSRGVMEKCTYCTQRIQEARINAEKENRPIRDGEVITACAQACPTQAIAFGDKNDKTSQVEKLRALPQHYYLLAELGARPRTSYLASIRNPNPRLGEEV